MTYLIFNTGFSGRKFKMLKLFKDKELTTPICEIIQFSSNNIINLTNTEKTPQKVIEFSNFSIYGNEVQFLYDNNTKTIEILSKPQNKNSLFVVLTEGEHIFENSKIYKRLGNIFFEQSVYLQNVSNDLRHENITINNILDINSLLGAQPSWISIIYNNTLFRRTPIFLQYSLEPHEMIEFSVLQMVPIKKLLKDKTSFIDIYLEIKSLKSYLD